MGPLLFSVVIFIPLQLEKTAFYILWKNFLFINSNIINLIKRIFGLKYDKIYS